MENVQICHSSSHYGEFKNGGKNEVKKRIDGMWVKETDR